MNRNYMVLKPGPGKNEEYTVRMLTENRIPGFLSFREKQVDGERWFYYDVTSRQPLGRILDAIHRPLGARSLDGVKRRTRAGMGRCQAGFCTPRTMELLHRELGIPMTEITKSGGESRLLVGTSKDTLGKEDA